MSQAVATPIGDAHAEASHYSRIYPVKVRHFETPSQPHKSLMGDLPMGYLPDPKTTTIFVTASSISLNGRKRKIIVETRPEFAIVQLQGSKERYSLAWETIFEAATKQDVGNRALERKANTSVSNSERLIGSKKYETDVGLPAKKPVTTVGINKLKFG